MARTLLSVTPLAQNNVAINPGNLDIGSVSPFVPAFSSDTINGNYFPLTGNEILLVHNTDSVPHNFLINTTPDHIGRPADLTYTVQAGGYAALEFEILEGWIQADGNVYLVALDPHVQFTVLKWQVVF
jgi:hypothetical protein